MLYETYNMSQQITFESLNSQEFIINIPENPKFYLRSYSGVGKYCWGGVQRYVVEKKQEMLVFPVYSEKIIVEWFKDNTIDETESGNYCSIPRCGNTAEQVAIDFLLQTVVDLQKQLYDLQNGEYVVTYSVSKN